MSMQRTFLAAGICLVVLTIVSVFVFLRGTPQTNMDTITMRATTTLDTTEAREVPDGWREYQNAAYHFSLLYPQELAVSERAEGDGAVTITFQNIEKGLGFQIFIIPYAEQQVSEERFKKDVPSGVRQGLENIQIAGATAAAFYSTDALLGETREIWFVRDGFLYEVTTLKALDSWLSDIISTWQFLQ